jgi:hypothetical protein
MAEECRAMERNQLLMIQEAQMQQTIEVLPELDTIMQSCQHACMAIFYSFIMHITKNAGIV